MRRFIHQPLDPFCRKVRLALAEKKLAFELEVEKPWDRREEFLALNPAGTVPVLVEQDGAIFSGHRAITEYLDEFYRDPDGGLVLLPGNPIERAEARRIADWFDEKFAEEVTRTLVDEKILKRFLPRDLGGGPPDTETVRIGMHNVSYHLDYISFLVERRNWLAGEDMTLADLTAAAHLSAVDYLGNVPWSDFPQSKDWYARIKSRPSFRTLLADNVPGMPAARHYANLDF